MGDVHGSVDLDVASELVCHMYAQSETKDVDEARYNRLMQVSGKVDQVGRAFISEFHSHRMYAREHPLPHQRVMPLRNHVGSRPPHCEYLRIGEL